MRMTKRERIASALRGEAVDRVPVAAWMHFPDFDRTAAGQVKAFVSFQEKFGWDFAKLMFRNSFLLEDWGCTYGDYHRPLGYWLPRAYAIQSPEDWTRLRPLEPGEGSFSEMVEVVSAVREALGEDEVTLATVFCPLMVARQLAGDRVVADLRAHPDAVHQGLQAITQTVREFALKCLDNGADGLFFATQSATLDYMRLDEYREFGHVYNLNVLGAVEGASQVTLLHICGQNILFDEFLNYPVHALNWDDRTGPPALAEARVKTDKALVGGIDKMGALRTGRPEDVEREALAAIRTAGKRGLILAPGCGLPIDVPDANLAALRHAVE